jgi:hypothetical protein
MTVQLSPGPGSRGIDPSGRGFGGAIAAVAGRKE